MSARIVVAGDHPVVVDGIRLMLNSIEGYELVGVATSLKEIISVYSTTLPAMLILDVHVEGKNSMDLVPELYHRHPNLKIIVFSAYQSTGLVKKALAIGINAYLLKDASKRRMGGSIGGKGRITDNQQTLPSVTILLLRANDSTLVRGVVTNTSGGFLVYNIAAGNYKNSVSK